ncbi:MULTISPECIES: MMPL family transporter [unclassified Rhodococcus (in: high G+C Gram-positive bacteria)]|uniref:MMPL family transporter n=1 Tax=unclassified Rhodococcus (in: high G+C Gram-positive bacteria) TaxID=192944 RepID=UPI00146BEDF3|nr:MULTISPECIES: efflux RND transporter permease subunit [unclassified Rhodococcus (in: high G+C Gram-positive bacteria)]MBF0662310.1 MMPL family transporter [Rhodococcus sp. (in: high G+C Gram-positive bacteria)]NMD95559.1 MMPL family transporter [Rhodococcus sp. BL-253-APC-6A1W]
MSTATAPPRKTGRWRWLLPALLLIAWLVAAGGGGPFAGKLSEVASTDASSFLPASAESTRADELYAQFNSSEFIPAIVVAERDGAITPEDIEFIASESAGPPPIPSEDGSAVQMIVPIDASGEVGDAVEELRTALENAPEGLTVHVTGPAGQAADLSSAFGGIDGLLLLVAGGVVLVILVVVYRSPILPFVVIISAVFALALASLVVYQLANADIIALNGQSQGIMFILVFGAATDYALLLVSRYREELRMEQDKYTAMRAALRGSIEPIAASAGTVILGVLCLLLSDLNSNRGLGPVAAIGIAASFLASVTFLPAALVLLGRTAFWPTRPKYEPGTDQDDIDSGHRFWGRVARWVGSKPRPIWIVCTLVLVAFGILAPQFKASGVASSDVFLLQTDSKSGQEVLGEHFDAGTGSPTIVVARESSLDAIVDATAGVEGVTEARPVTGPGDVPVVIDGLVAVQATLSDPADSLAAEQTVERIRDVTHAVPEADALVGGPTAVDLDTKDTATRDRTLIIPVVTLVVLLVLIVLLRAVVAPILLMLTVILSFAATLGVSSLLFNHVFGFPGADPVVPLFGFVFLVALGIDYNIFLMTRVREETKKVGTRQGVLRALTVTGGVITSAGVVLAATFSALAVIPLLFLAQLAFIVAFGVLLDALLVRALLVPALSIDIGKKIWWPSALSRTEPDEHAATDDDTPGVTPTPESGRIR